MEIDLPHWNEFLIRGLCVAEAAEIRSKWQLLNARDLEALGFTGVLNCGRSHPERPATALPYRLH